MAEAPNFPVDLFSVYFTKTIIESLPGFDFGNGQPDTSATENKISVSSPSDPEGVFIITMNTSYNIERSDRYPYYMDIECIVLMKARDGHDPLEQKKAAHISGHSVAYGAIRELVSWVTGRHPFGTLTLGLSIIQPKPPESE
jgi:hypothetical protein